MKKELNYRKMIEDIDSLVNTNFMLDMENKGANEKLTPKEIKELMKILTKIYFISHKCSSCNKRYEIE